jgi:hypothetical protein
MKKRTLFIAIFSSIILHSCNEIDKKELTVIEDIVLGSDYKFFTNQLDSLNIKNMIFYSESYFSGYEEIPNYQFKAYLTELFDLAKFGNQDLHHLGLFYPITLEGNNNVIGLNVIIGHTEPAFIINKTYGITNLSQEYNIFRFSQTITYSMLFEIKLMLISKYGQPKYENSNASDFISYYIKGKQIEEFTGDEKTTGTLCKWETEHLVIELFEGLPSRNVKFTPDGYIVVKDRKMLLPEDLKEGESFCQSYVCITYKIKSETLEKLKLDVSKL